MSVEEAQNLWVLYFCIYCRHSSGSYQTLRAWNKMNELEAIYAQF